MSKRLITKRGVKPGNRQGINSSNKEAQPQQIRPYLHSRLSELIWSATRLCCWRRERWEKSPCSPVTVAPRAAATSIRHRAKSNVNRSLCTVSVCSCWTPTGTEERQAEKGRGGYNDRILNGGHQNEVLHSISMGEKSPGFKKRQVIQCFP